jgi:alkylated DNA repair dioxygenase AlkB
MFEQLRYARVMSMDLSWQPSLFEGPEVTVRAHADFAGLRRHELGAGAWVDVAPHWCDGADALFARLLTEVDWGPQRQVRMYDGVVAEPRLTHRWELGADPGPPPELVEMGRLLSRRYGVHFTQIGANLYRDGADSVAWHGDRVARELPTATVALVSLGAVRPFRLRPTGGGEGLGFLPGPGDLLVMGGSCQRTWQHAVPKVRASAPRISVQFRHAYPRPG